MAFKMVVLLALLAMANAGILGHYDYAAPQHYAYAAPALAKVAAPLPYAKVVSSPIAYAAPAIAKVAATPVLTKHIDEEYDPNPQYSYAYDVQDSITGDNKQQQESRNGDSVQGSYSFIEADGTRRIVEYTADPLNGFNAVVHKEPAVAKIAAAPVIAKAAQPISYVAPAPALYTKSLAYAAPAPIITKQLAYAAPAPIIAKPLAYAAPAPIIAKPLAYAAPALTYGAPIAKIIH